MCDSCFVTLPAQWAFVNSLKKIFIQKVCESVTPYDACLSMGAFFLVHKCLFVITNELRVRADVLGVVVSVLVVWFFDATGGTGVPKQ